MSREYESEADRRDQDQKELESNLKGAKNKAQKLKNFADNHIEQGGISPRKDEVPPDYAEKNQVRQSGVDARGNAGAEQKAAEKAKEEAIKQETAKDIGRETGKEAGKEIAKEAGKEAGKQASKEGAKSGAQAALAGTGAGAPVAAAIKGLDKTAKQIKAVGENTKAVAKEAGEEASSTGANITAHRKKAENMYEDNTIVKILLGFMAVLLAIILIIVILIQTIMNTLLGPVTTLFNGINHGWESAKNALSELGGKHEYKDIADHYEVMIQDAMTKAFDEVCFDEVYQIALEQEYDWDLTLESFKNNIFPYIFDGANCNVNYMEILSVIGMAEEFNVFNYDYDKFKELFEDKEFLRCLYDLKVERAEHHIYDDQGNIIDTIIYGEVSIKEYPLSKLFSYFGIDPYAKSLQYKTLTNYQALSVISSYTMLEDPTINWGRNSVSRLFDYSMYTGEITEHAENIYAEDMHQYFELDDYGVSNGVPLYAQSDPAWGSLKYGSRTISSLGCCLTSISMIASYFTGEAITPAVMSAYINEEHSGSLVRDSIAKHYGFLQYDTQVPVSAQRLLGQLQTGRLLIVHIKNGHLGHSPKYGHYVVMTGYEVDGDDVSFQIADPAGGKEYSLSASEALYHLDYEWSYGR